MAKLVLCHVAKLSKIKQMWHLQMICSKFAIGLNPFFRPVYRELQDISNVGTLQRMSRMTKHVSKAGKVDPDDRVTLPVKFVCKKELTLTRLPG